MNPPRTSSSRPHVQPSPRLPGGAFLLGLGVAGLLAYQYWSQEEEEPDVPPVRWKHTTDRSNLRRRVSQYARGDRWTAFKIGVSSDPEGRVCWNDYCGVYDDMVVLYETNELHDAYAVERELIDFFREYCDNVSRGGDGRMGEKEPPYYVYVVRG